MKKPLLLAALVASFVVPAASAAKPATTLSISDPNPTWGEHVMFSWSPAPASPFFFISCVQNGLAVWGVQQSDFGGDPSLAGYDLGYNPSNPMPSGLAHCWASLYDGVHGKMVGQIQFDISG